MKEMKTNKGTVVVLEIELFGDEREGNEALIRSETALPTPQPGLI